MPLNSIMKQRSVTKVKPTREPKSLAFFLDTEYRVVNLFLVAVLKPR